VLSDALAAELGDGDVLVTCIQPGLVKTGLHHRWEIAPEGSAGYPLEPEDFARMVLFVLEQCSPRNRTEMPEPVEAVERAPEAGSAAIAEEPVKEEKPAASGGWEFAAENGDGDAEEGLKPDEV
jgi:NAD(P)-dependent dehydrogenase (short-subunit alcohol dehydrogenase family)